MPTGIVKWFDPRKGFGFIVDAQSKDVFVHYSVIEGDGFRRLLNGETVEFDLAEGPHGLFAAKVRRWQAGAGSMEPSGVARAARKVRTS
jgi:cold shock protein